MQVKYVLFLLAVVMLFCAPYSALSQDEMELLDIWDCPVGGMTSISFTDLCAYNGNLYFAGQAGVYILEIQSDGTFSLLNTIVPAPGENSYAVRVVDDIAYIGTSHYMYTFDVSNPAAPESLSYCTLSSPYLIEIDGNTACVFGLHTLQLVDITDPTSISCFSTQATSYLSLENAFAIEPPFAFAAGDEMSSFNGGISIFDYSNPADITESGSFTHGTGMFSQATGIAVKDSFIYVAGHPDCLTIYKANEAHDALETVTIWGDGACRFYSVTVKDSFLVLGGFSEVYILNVSDPEDVVLVDNYEDPALVYRFFQIDVMDSLIFCYGTQSGSGTHPYQAWMLKYDFGESTSKVIERVATPTNLNINCSPNPFNKAVSIVTMPGALIEIYDEQGRLIETMIAENSNTWNPSNDINSGVYVIRSSLNGAISSEKVVYIK